MAFREKMLWASSAVTLLIWGRYFIGFSRDFRAGVFDQGDAIGAFVFAVILLVIAQVVVAIVLALVSGSEADARPDDRERQIALAAYRPAYFVLSAGVVVLLLWGPALLRIVTEWHEAAPPGMAPILLGNALLAALVLAELVHSGAQLIRYRRGG